MKTCENCGADGMARYVLAGSDSPEVIVPQVIWVCGHPQCFCAYTEEQYRELQDGPFNPHPLEEKSSGPS